MAVLQVCDNVHCIGVGTCFSLTLAMGVAYNSGVAMMGGSFA